MSCLVQRLNALMVISARSGRLISSGFSPHPTMKSEETFLERELSPDTKVPSEFPDDFGSYDHLEFEEDDSILESEQQSRMETLR